MFGISQPTVSRIIEEVTDALSSNDTVTQFMKFLPYQRYALIREREVYTLAHFPGVVGVIDGTHIQIHAPRFNDTSDVNRHFYHSINVCV